MKTKLVNLSVALLISQLMMAQFHIGVKPERILARSMVSPSKNSSNMAITLVVLPKLS